MSEIKSGDRVEVSNEGEALFQAFALEDFNTDDQTERTVKVRVIGEVGSDNEIGEEVNVHLPAATVTVVPEPVAPEESAE